MYKRYIRVLFSRVSSSLYEMGGGGKYDDCRLKVTSLMCVSLCVCSHVGSVVTV